MAYTSDIDHGYAWVALLAVFSIQFIIGIITYSTGVINIAIMEEVDGDITKTSWIGSTLFGTYTLFGVGVGLGGNVIGVVPGKYFRKRRPAAYGICMTGCGAGLFVGGPLCQYLLYHYNLYGTLLILGGIGFNMCVAGALLRPVTEVTTCPKEDEPDTQEGVALKTFQTDDPVDMSQTDEKSLCLVKEVHTKHMQAISSSKDQPQVETHAQFEESTFINETKIIRKVICFNWPLFRKAFHIFGQFPFVIYSLSIMLWSLGEGAWMFHLPNYAEHKGSSPVEAASLLTAMGAGSIFSRIFAGMAASDSNIDAVLLQVGLAGLAGTVSFLFTVGPSSYMSQLAFSYFYATYSQGINTLIGPIIINLLGLPHVAVAYGIVCFFCGLGHLLGPPIARTCLVLGSIATALTSIGRRNRSTHKV